MSNTNTDSSRLESHLYLIANRKFNHQSRSQKKPSAAPVIAVMNLCILSDESLVDSLSMDSIAKSNAFAMAVFVAVLTAEDYFYGAS